MSPRDFLPIADQWKGSAVEAERRTSVGRAYYGLFHILCDSLSRRGVIFRKIPQDHQSLIDYLARAEDRTAKSISQILKDLRVERNRADYSLDEHIVERNSELVYHKATMAIADFDAITPDRLDRIVQRIQKIR